MLNTSQVQISPAVPSPFSTHGTPINISRDMSLQSISKPTPFILAGPLGRQARENLGLDPVHHRTHTHKGTLETQIRYTYTEPGVVIKPKKSRAKMLPFEFECCFRKPSA